MNQINLSGKILILILTASIFIICLFNAHAKDSGKWYDSLSPQWGGHVKTRGNITWQDHESLYKLVGTGPYYNGSGEIRLKNKLFFSRWGIFEAHYEAVCLGGDTRNKTKKLESIYKNAINNINSVNDDPRLFNLTKIINENDDYILYHRMDRLSLTLNTKNFNACIGRQALTWGNGMLFNPMDLFNPFAPTDIIRDYKIGDDMITTRFYSDKLGEFQLLYVPRKNINTHDITWNNSAFAGKLHFAADTTEFDFVLGKNYENYIIGLGTTGYIKDAAWRVDGTWTFLPDQSSKTGYLSLVANMDYSWVWKNKNFYGFAELYFNGLGDDNYTQAIENPDIINGFNRGEIFTLAKFYFAGSVNIELHSLLNFYLTIISNLEDPCAVFQPRFVWNASQNIEVITGANINYGKSDTEFGGFKIPHTDFVNAPAQSAYIWVTYFF